MIACPVLVLMFPLQTLARALGTHKAAGAAAGSGHGHAHEHAAVEHKVEHKVGSEMREVHHPPDRVRTGAHVDTLAKYQDLHREVRPAACPAVSLGRDGCCVFVSSVSIEKHLLGLGGSRIRPHAPASPVV